MTWTVEFDDAATIELRKLDKQAQQEILRYFRERIATDEDPAALLSHRPAMMQATPPPSLVVR